MSDKIKQQALDTLNHFRITARSINKVAVGIRDIQHYAKEQFGLKQQEVIVSLDYLIQYGWVDEVIEKREFKKGNTIIPTESSKYKLSAQGITLYDSESVYNSLNRYSGINIENIGGVVVVGNNNVVNNKYRDLFTSLDTLENQIKLSDKLSDENKLNASADLQTVKDQLSKSQPNKSIIDIALKGLSIAASLSGASELLEKIIKTFQSLI